MDNKQLNRISPKMMLEAAGNSIIKLSPDKMWSIPVMFTVEIGAILTTVSMFFGIFTKAGHAGVMLTLHISVWLWLTVIFANFA